MADLEVKCECGADLNAEFTSAKKGRPMLEVEPCDNCKTDSYEEGKLIGHEKGKEEGHAEGFKEGRMEADDGFVTGGPNG